MGRKNLGRKEYKIKLTDEEASALRLLCEKLDYTANPGKGRRGSFSLLLQKLAINPVAIATQIIRVTE